VGAAALWAAAGLDGAQLVTLGDVCLAIADEGFRRENGWGNRHFLLRTNRASPAS
jgi:hypothetical protein